MSGCLPTPATSWPHTNPPTWAKTAIAAVRARRHQAEVALDELVEEPDAQEHPGRDPERNTIAPGRAGRRHAPVGRRAAEERDERLRQRGGEAAGEVERGVALEREVDVALERGPAVLDVDVEVVARDLGVPVQPLQGRAAHLCVVAAVLAEDAHVQLVVDGDDAARAPGVG